MPYTEKKKKQHKTAEINKKLKKKNQKLLLTSTLWPLTHLLLKWAVFILGTLLHTLLRALEILSWKNVCERVS